MKRLLPWVLLMISILFILWQANQNLWQYHLRADVDGQYLANAQTFIKNGNLSKIGYNEYQPGAVIFFLLLSPVLYTQISYLTALFFVNIILIIILAKIYQKINPKSIIFFSLILLASGPILLFRFELFVGLLTVLSLVFAAKNRWVWAYVFLGLATSVKIYPVLLLPYFLMIAPKKKFIYFVLSLSTIFAIYFFLLKVPIPSFLESLAIHAKKPVHIESLWGTILTLTPWFFTGYHALGKGEWGIYGLDPAYFVLPLFFYNYFWVVPLGIFYSWLLVSKQFLTKIHFEPAVLIILLFLIFSKILTAQYLFWFILLLPLIPKLKISTMIPVILTLFLTQLVYPLGYNELLGCFYAGGSCFNIFWMLTLRNGLLFVILTQLIWSF